MTREQRNHAAAFEALHQRPSPQAYRKLVEASRALNRANNEEDDR